MYKNEREKSTKGCKSAVTLQNDQQSEEIFNVRAVNSFQAKLKKWFSCWLVEQ